MNIQEMKEEGRTYIGNAFSLGMVAEGATIRTKKVNLPSIAKRLDEPVSIVGHADTARVFSDLLGINVAHNRASIKLDAKDILYVGQLVGGRLPEGATTLPEGFSITWICVRVDGDAIPYEQPIGRGSIYASIVAAGEQIANLFPHAQAETKAMQDSYGNLVVEVIGHGLHATLWDD